MLTAPGEPPPNIIHRDIVSAFDDSLPHAPNRFAHVWNPNEMQFDGVAALFRLLEQIHVRSSAQG